YLWKEDYAACAELCTQIISSGQFSLLPVNREEAEALDEMGEPTLVYYANDGDISDLFNKIYYRGNSVESIFELQFGEDKNNPFVGWFRPVLGVLQANTSNINAEYFPSSSIDRRWSDIRPEVSFKQSGGTVWKWIGTSQQGTEYRDINASFCNWIFYRLADIILMKAEALTQQAIAESNNQEKLQEAAGLLRQIRTRANAPESTDLLYKQDETNINARTLEEFILNERAREFLFEGKRWFDVLRHVKRDNFRNKEYLLRLAVLSVSPEKISIVQEKWSNYPGSLYMPIYFEELNVNKNLVQNEFYK
ncbi:MAG: RagB/SusD family nutrient uptake outer membrane protein, partial [Dysgonamonadaceae bacterium]|nr:RagB/SusD family nutrient uptake outer membrane protein [Dysgonamonadaceae bacterium]